MLPKFLLPESVVRESGTGPVTDLGATGRILLVTLAINRSVEQESIDLTVFGSPDGETWSAQPLLRFPHKYYCGTYSMILDLSARRDIRYLQVEYKTNRWGRAETLPLFGCSVFVQDTATSPVASRAVA